MSFLLNNESYDQWIRAQEKLFGADLYPINVRWEFSFRANSAPNVTNLVYPNNDFITNTSSAINFSFTAVDDTNPIDNCSLFTNFSGTWKNNATIIDVANNTMANITITNMPEGTFRWNIECEDSKNLKGNFSQNYTIIFDYTRPYVDVLAIAPNPANHTFSNVAVDWTSSDSHLNTSLVNVNYPNGTLMGVYHTNFTLTPDNLTVPGNYSITVFE